MGRWTEEGIAWRDFIFANRDEHFDYKEIVSDFKSRVEIIRDSKEAIIEELLQSKVKNIEVIEANKEEIEYQIENLREYIEKFAEYCKFRILNIDVKGILSDISKNDCSSSLYLIINEYEDIAEKTEGIIKIIDKGCQIYIDNNIMTDSFRDLLMKSIMDELKKII